MLICPPPASVQGECARWLSTTTTSSRSCLTEMPHPSRALPTHPREPLTSTPSVPSSLASNLPKTEGLLLVRFWYPLSLCSNVPLDDEDRNTASRNNSVKGLHRSSSSSNLPSPSNLAAKDPFNQLHDRSSTYGKTRPISSPTSQNKCKRTSPSFRDFLPNQSPFSPRTFSTALPAPATSGSSLRSNLLFTLHPAGGSLTHLSQTDQDRSVYFDEYNPRYPPHLSEVVAEAFADVTFKSALIPQTTLHAVDDNTFDHIVPDSAHTANVGDDQNPVVLSPLLIDLSTNESTMPGPCELVPFSQTGIVHLGPLYDTSDGQPGSRSSPGGHSPGLPCGPGSRSRSYGHSQLPRFSALAPLGEQDAHSPGHSVDVSRSSSGPLSSSLASRSDSDDSRGPASAQHMTLRYQHAKDENGHHLIVGREGKLTRCEDEVSDTIPVFHSVVFIFI